MRAVRPVFALALVGVAASASFAFADSVDPAKNSATSKTLYMAAEGCGQTAEAGRLEQTPQADGGDGCGTIGGLPFNEVVGSSGEDYTSTPKLAPFMLDTTKKIKGQVAAENWNGVPVQAGTVTWDVALVGSTKSGKTVDFGTTTVTAAVTPGGSTDAYAQFTLAVPAAAKNETFKTFALNVVLRGQNFGFSSVKLSGEEYLTLPVKPAPAKKK